MSNLSDELDAIAKRHRKDAADLRAKLELRNQLITKGLGLLLKAVDLAVDQVGEVQGVELQDLWEKVREHL